MSLPKPQLLDTLTPYTRSHKFEHHDLIRNEGDPRSECFSVATSVIYDLLIMWNFESGLEILLVWEWVHPAELVEGVDVVFLICFFNELAVIPLEVFWQLTVADGLILWFHVVLASFFEVCVINSFRYEILHFLFTVFES